MLLKVNEDLHLEASPAEVWALLRNTARLAGLLPGVESVTRIESAEGEAYAARASEKVGPFKITMTLEVRVTEVQDGSVLKAAIKGGDSVGLNRVTGSRQMAWRPPQRGRRCALRRPSKCWGRWPRWERFPFGGGRRNRLLNSPRNFQGQFAKERS